MQLSDLWTLRDIRRTLNALSATASADDNRFLAWWLQCAANYVHAACNFLERNYNKPTTERDLPTSALTERPTGDPQTSALNTKEGRRAALLKYRAGLSQSEPQGTDGGIE